MIKKKIKIKKLKKIYKKAFFKESIENAYILYRKSEKK